MNQPDDGGQAFPRIESIDKEAWTVNHTPVHLVNTTGGMTLRDYFAAAALRGIMAKRDMGDFEDDKSIAWDGESHMRKVVELAYRMADAMLKERNKNVPV